MGEANGAFSGLYIGTFTGFPSPGEFAFLVLENGTAMLVESDFTVDGGGYVDNVLINSDGTFSKNGLGNNAGFSLTGSITADSVSGTYINSTGRSGTFYGTKQPSTGPFKEAGGYYSGSFQGLCSDGNLFGFILAIVSVDGTSFFVTDSGTGFKAAFSQDGKIQGITTTGSIFNGAMDMSSFTINGTWNQPSFGCSGTWALTQRVKLPLGLPVKSIVIDFGEPNGIWIRVKKTQWAKLHDISAKSMIKADMDGSGIDEVIIDFGAQNGIWIRLNNSQWLKLVNVSAKSMVSADIDGNGKDDVIIDFGDQNGIWIRLNNSQWIKLHSLSAKSMTAADMDGNGKDEVIIDFDSGNGIWIRQNNSQWIKLHSLSAKSMTVGDMDGNGKDEVIMDFDSGNGIWVRENNTQWVKLHDFSSKSMLTVNLGE